MFQELLSKSSKIEEVEIVNDLKSILENVKSLNSYYHPAHMKVKEILNAKFNIIFSNVEEVTDLLKLYDYHFVPLEEDEEKYVWREYNSHELITFSKKVFNEKGLIRKQEWNNLLIEYDNDDIPF